MNDTEQRNNAKEFAEEWKDRGYEKGESQTFWLELLNSLGFLIKDNWILDIYMGKVYFNRYLNLITIREDYIRVNHYKYVLHMESIKQFKRQYAGR